MSRKTAREEQSDETGKHATPSGQQGHGGTSNEMPYETTRREASETTGEGWGQSRRHAARRTQDAPPRRDANKQNRKIRHPLRAITTTTIRHETLHEMADKTNVVSEERETRGGTSESDEREIQSCAVFPSSYENETKDG